MDPPTPPTVKLSVQPKKEKSLAAQFQRNLQVAQQESKTWMKVADYRETLSPLEKRQIFGVAFDGVGEAALREMEILELNADQYGSATDEVPSPFCFNCNLLLAVRDDGTLEDKVNNKKVVCHICIPGKLEGSGQKGLAIQMKTLTTTAQIPENVPFYFALAPGYVQAYILRVPQTKTALKAQDSIISMLHKDLTPNSEASCSRKERECNACHRVFRRTLARCGKCGVAKYCSRECQVGHWGEHKKECKKKRSSNTEEKSVTVD